MSPPRPFTWARRHRPALVGIVCGIATVTLLSEPVPRLSTLGPVQPLPVIAGVIVGFLAARLMRLYDPVDPKPGKAPGEGDG